MLVLDEPTAHLDRETEQAVMRDLLAGTDSRTVLLSTHRPVGEGHLDQVLRIDAGRLLPTLPAA